MTYSPALALSHRCEAAEAEARLYADRLDEARATIGQMAQEAAAASQKQAKLFGEVSQA